MKIDILEPVLIGARVANPGDVIDVSDELGRRHVRAGTAVEFVVVAPECAALAPGPESAAASPRPSRRRVATPAAES